MSLLVSDVPTSEQTNNHTFRETSNPAHMEFFLYRGDATNAKALEKEKVHMSSVMALTQTVEELIQGLPATWICAYCDLQPVRQGTSDELLGLIRKQYASVGAPSIFDRAQTARYHPHRLTLAIFVLDHGPDNVGIVNPITCLVHPHKNLMVLFWFCFFHQLQLITEASIKRCVEFEWDFPAEGSDDSPLLFDVNYIGGIKCIVNTWRSSRMPHKVRSAANKILGAQRAKKDKKKIKKR